jgi:hypothetical protein
MAYNKIKLYERQDINYVKALEGTATQTEIDAVTGAKIHSPSWDSKTIALATFNDISGNGLNANDIVTTDSIIGYKIQRQNIKEDLLYTVATVGDETLKIQDYNIQNLNTYQYRVIPIFEIEGVQTLGSPIITENITTNFQDWSVIGLNITDEKNTYIVDENNIWNFKLNTKGNPFSLKYDKTYTEGFGRFPKASYGNRNYIESGLQSLLGQISINGTYINDNIDLIERWENFCNDGQLKLIKDTKGHVLPIDIKSTSYDNMKETYEQATTISFEFTQLADHKELQIYGLAVL